MCGGRTLSPQPGHHLVQLQTVTQYTVRVSTFNLCALRYRKEGTAVVPIAATQHGRNDAASRHRHA